MKGFVSIVISGEPKSGKSTLAGMLAKAYGWQRLSLGDMWREKWRKLYPNEEVPFDVFWKGTTIDENRRMNVEAKKIFEKGKMVGDSRFVSYLNPSKCFLIFMTASLETRAKRSANGEYKGKSIAGIKRLLKKREMDEVQMGMKLFKNDYRDPEHYHLILNSGILTPEQEFNIVRSIV
ncbi:MAG: cytidylate kinase family protein [Candidatus Micrarchaeota archaeon]|nr:cytidylate kinase family protein [Candidatus Micrarchaeota archaeon]MDE1849597.1 cytidylate kinase family protein [Candidatus Micrarchaeota archaeon]